MKVIWLMMPTPTSSLSASCLVLVEIVVAVFVVVKVRLIERHQVVSLDRGSNRKIAVIDQRKSWLVHSANRPEADCTYKTKLGLPCSLYPGFGFHCVQSISSIFICENLTRPYSWSNWILWHGCSPWLCAYRFLIATSGVWGSIRRGCEIWSCKKAFG